LAELKSFLKPIFSEKLNADALGHIFMKTIKEIFSPRIRFWNLMKNNPCRFNQPIYNSVYLAISLKSGFRP
jgi:hypothetical protein